MDSLFLFMTKDIIILHKTKVHTTKRNGCIYSYPSNNKKLQYLNEATSNFHVSVLPVKMPGVTFACVRVYSQSCTLYAPVNGYTGDRRVEHDAFLLLFFLNYTLSWAQSSSPLFWNNMLSGKTLTRPGTLQHHRFYLYRPYHFTIHWPKVTTALLFHSPDKTLDSATKTWRDDQSLATCLLSLSALYPFEIFVFSCYSLGKSMATCTSAHR